MIPILLIFSPRASKNTLQNGSNLIPIPLFNFAAVAIVRCTCAYTIFHLVRRRGFGFWCGIRFSSCPMDVKVA